MIMDYQLGEYRLKIFPEAYSPYPAFLLRNGFISIGGIKDNHLSVIMINDKGEILDKRGKNIMPEGDIKNGYEPTDDFRVFQLGDFIILPVICMEITSYSLLKKIDCPVDLITHHVNYGMNNKEQYYRWQELQNKWVEHFECPLVCSCGDGFGINLSRIIEFVEMKIE